MNALNALQQVVLLFGVLFLCTGCHAQHPGDIGGTKLPDDRVILALSYNWPAVATGRVKNGRIVFDQVRLEKLQEQGAPLEHLTGLNCIDQKVKTALRPEERFMWVMVQYSKKGTPLENGSPANQVKVILSNTQKRVVETVTCDDGLQVHMNLDLKVGVNLHRCTFQQNPLVFRCQTVQDSRKLLWEERPLPEKPRRNPD